MLEDIFRRFPSLRLFYKAALIRFFNLSGSKEGVKVMEEDWNNLVILDGCRYDYFKKINHLNGKLEKKISLASNTGEWIEKNFQKKYPDVVYISGNPQLSAVKLKERLGRVPFCHLERVWDWGWNEELNTVPPEKITEATVSLLQDYPKKRYMIHYMQPHAPFLKLPTYARRILEFYKSRKNEETDLFQRLWLFVENLMNKNSKKAVPKLEGTTSFSCARAGMVEIDTIEKAYIENLIIVLGEVEKLLKHLKGRTILTSDHGNLFGKYWIYGHPPRIRFKELVEIPWLIIDS